MQLHCKNKFAKSSVIKSAEICLSGKIRLETAFYRIVNALLLILFSFFIPALVPLEKAFMYLKTIWWAVLLGLCLGGVIDHYVPREYISKILSVKAATILNAVALVLMSACRTGYSPFHAVA